MPSPRALLMLATAPAGLVLGSLGWLVFAGHGPAARPLSGMEARLSSARPLTVAAYSARADRTAQIVGSPLFALTTGPGAVSDVAIRLEGLARSREHAAALVSIDNKPAEWLALGETRDGVTLREVQGSKIVVDTATGFKEVALGDQSAAAK